MIEKYKTFKLELAKHEAKVAGIKASLVAAEKELANMRAAEPKLLKSLIKGHK
jgi:hypothetical protein